MINLTVLHATTSWLPLTQTWIYRQILSLPECIVTYIVCHNLENDGQFPVQNLKCQQDAPWWRLQYYRFLRKIGFREQFTIDQIKRCNPQLLHSHFGNVAWSNIRAAQKTHVKHLVTFYGYDVNYLPESDLQWRLRYKELFANIDLVLCEGPYMAQSIMQLGCPEKKVRVHHLGIPVHEIQFLPPEWHEGQPLKVLIAASFTEKKGIPYALFALAEIANECDIEVTIIGDAPASADCEAEKRRILQIIDATALRNKTRLLGYQPHSILFEEAYKHHVFISPSVTASTGDTEGGAPVTIIEMCAVGLLIVSTRHCDIPEVILDGVTGLLADERNVSGLVEHLRWLIHNQEKWEQMVTAGRRRMESEFDAVAQGRRLSEIYLSMVKS